MFTNSNYELKAPTESSAGRVCTASPPASHACARAAKQLARLGTASSPRQFGELALRRCNSNSNSNSNSGSHSNRNTNNNNRRRTQQTQTAHAQTAILAPKDARGSSRRANGAISSRRESRVNVWGVVLRSARVTHLPEIESWRRAIASSLDSCDTLRFESNQISQICSRQVRKPAPLFGLGAAKEARASCSRCLLDVARLID